METAFRAYEQEILQLRRENRLMKLEKRKMNRLYGELKKKASEKCKECKVKSRVIEAMRITMKASHREVKSLNRTADDHSPEIY